MYVKELEWDLQILCAPYVLAVIPNPPTTSINYFGKEAPVLQEPFLCEAVTRLRPKVCDADSYTLCALKP